MYYAVISNTFSFSYPTFLEQWNEDDVKRFLVEKNMDCLVGLYGRMNGRALRNIYRMYLINSDTMLQEINADLAATDGFGQNQKLNNDQYTRFLHELKPFVHHESKTNLITPTSALCIVM